MTPRRAQRREPGGRVLTPRELVALRFLADAQPISTYDIQALLCVSYPIALRSVRKLRDLGVVTVHVPRMDGPNVLTLAEAGRRELARVTGEDPSTFRVVRALPAGNPRHHALGVRFAVSLTVATAKAPRLALERHAFEYALRAGLGHDGQDALVPDGVAVLASQGTLHAVALEADSGTENPSWFLRQKALPYATLHEAGAPLMGAPSWRVAIVTENPRRLERLARSLWSEGLPGELFHFAVSGDLTSEAILKDAPWVTWEDETEGEDEGLVRRSPFVPGQSNRSVGLTGLSAQTQGSPMVRHGGAP